MRAKYVFYPLTSICSFILFLIILNVVEAQSVDNQSDSNVTRKDLNITSSIEFIGPNNVSNLAEQYDEFQRFESGPPSKIIDKEAFESESIEKLKDNIERFESSVPPGKIMTFDLNGILNSDMIGNATNINSTDPKKFNNTIDVNQSQNIDVNQSQKAQLSNPTKTQYTLKKWEGLNINTASPADGAGVPPDVALAVGPDDVVQMVHSAMSIWDKTGNEKLNVFLSDFFRIKEPHSLADPIVLYDHSEGKWFSVIMEISPQSNNGEDESCYYDCFLRVAVSTDKDPSQPWNIYRIPFGKNLPDYPMVGINNNKLGIGVNIFKSTGGYLGTQAILIDKNDLLNDDASISPYFSSIFPNYYTIVPVSSDTECLHMEANNWDLRTEHVDGIVVFEACGNPTTSNFILNEKQIKTQRLLLPVDAVQPDNLKSETDLAKIRSPVYFNGTIVSGVNYSCDEGGDLKSCIGLLKIGINESLPIVDFVGISPGNNYHVFYPALSLNKDGNLVMVYGVSSSEIYPSLLVMILDQNFNILYNTLLVKGDGNTNYLSTPDPRSGKRFGDYFTSVTDPIDKSVWMSGEYGNKNIQKSWSTYVGNIS